MNNLCRLVLACCLAAFLATSSAFAQSFTASVRGTVTDDSGASIGSAKVIITDAERGTNSTATTDENGRYVITALPPGTYIMSVEAQGFKRFASGRFTLNVQQQSTVDAK